MSTGSTFCEFGVGGGNEGGVALVVTDCTCEVTIRTASAAASDTPESGEKETAGGAFMVCVTTCPFGRA